MKICFVTNNINPKAGLGRMVNSIADGLIRRGHDVGYVVSSGESDCEILKINFSFSVKHLHKTVRDLLRMRVFVKKYDVIVCFDVQSSGMLAHMATVCRNDRIVIHSLGSYSLFTESKRIKNKIIEIVYKKSKKIFIINDFVRRKIEESNLDFTFSKNVVNVPVGVDVSLFSKKRVAKNVTYEEYLISVGALKSRKGQLESVKAFCSIANEFPNLKYLLIGSTTDSPTYYQKIKSFLNDQGLTDRVFFLQDVTDEALINLYSNALFFILTPVSTKTSLEGFGMVYIESALCGITSIGTYDSGAEEAIIDGKSGILVQNTVPDIAKAIKFLLENKVKREQLAEYANNRARTFSWDCVVDLYESELTKIIYEKS